MQCPIKYPYLTIDIIQILWNCCIFYVHYFMYIIIFLLNCCNLFAIFWGISGGYVRDIPVLLAVSVYTVQHGKCASWQLKLKGIN